MLIALCLDRLIGWPDQLYRRLSHPVVGIGVLISTADQLLNRDSWPPAVRRAAGVFCLLVIIAGLSLLCRLIVSCLPSGWAGIGLTAIFAHAGVIRSCLALAFDSPSAALKCEINPLSVTRLRALPDGQFSVVWVNRAGQDFQLA